MVESPHSPGKILRVVVAAANGSDRQRIANILGEHPHLQLVGISEDGGEACRMVAEITPDVVLLDEHLPELDGVAAAMTVWLATPQVATVLMSDEPPAVLRRAMQAGVKDVIRKPIVAAELLEAMQLMQRLESKRASPAYRAMLDPSLAPRVLTVTGAKGGIGKSTLATNLAVVLAQQHPGEAVLIDLYSHYGDVPLMLDMRPKRTLLDMLPSLQDIDEELVDAHLTTHASGLKVLPGSNTTADLTQLTAPLLGQVLSTLKRKYRFVVLDVPAILYETTIYALTHATAVVLVVNLFDLTTLRDTHALYQALQGWSVPRERLHLVLNRVDRRNRFRLDEIARMFGREATGLIPNNANIVVSSINEGVPFVLGFPQAAITKSMQTLANRLINGHAGDAEEQPAHTRLSKIS